jgi:opacity protein-like surface antigen
MKAFAALALLTATVAVPAMAQTNWYAGVGVGRGNLNVSGTDLTGLGNAQVEDNGTVWGLDLGYRFHPNFALEAGYYDLGKYDFSGRAGAVNVTGNAKLESYSISLVATAPLGEQFDLYGRVGYAHSKFKFSATGPINSAFAADTQDEATYGIGGHWWFNRQVGLYAEWMKNDKTELDNYMAGIRFRF